MNARNMKLAATFTLAIAATGCTGAMLTPPETVGTLSSGENTWTVDRSTHGSNTLYTTSCVPKAADDASAKNNTDVEYIGKIQGVDMYYSYFKGHAVYLPACAPGNEATVNNNVRTDNRGKGEIRNMTSATVVPKNK